MCDWTKIRKDFPVTKKYAYFQSAAMSPLARPVYEAIVRNYRAIYEFGDKRWDEDLASYKRMLQSIGGLLDTEAENLTFMPNTSTAIALVALTLKNNAPRSFNVVSLEDEFPASTIGFEYQGIPMRYVQPRCGAYSIGSILDQTDKDTLAVVTSYVQYATGFRLDIETLGRALGRRDILFIVNATQAFPYFPVDIQKMHIDVMTASLHKWGLAGHLGSLFFTSRAFREQFPPAIAGWLSVDSDNGLIHTAKNAPFRLHASAGSYDFGTFNLQALLAFQASLDYMKSIGFENIRKRIHELTDYLIAGLKDIGLTIISPVQTPEIRSAIVTFEPRMDYTACVKELEKRSILVSPRAGYVRAAVNIFNSFDDIDRLLEALRTPSGNPAQTT
jgi:cysteine desulfurase/selenocysteine lyase